MAVRIPEFKVASYGNAMRQGQTIKAAGLNIKQTENMIRGREKAKQVRMQMGNMPDAIDKLEEMGEFEQADKMRNNYQSMMKNGVEVVKSMSRSITPENYKEVKEGFQQSGTILPGAWPTEYSKKFVDSLGDKEKATLTKHSRRWEENGINVTQDLMAKDGDIFWTGTPFESAADKTSRTGKGGKGGKGGFTYKAADDNAMGKQASQLFGGFYDPTTGQFAGLDKDKAAKVQAVHAAASEIFAQAQGTKTHAQAVREAAGKLKINIENPDDWAATDPASIEKRNK